MWTRSYQRFAQLCREGGDEKQAMAAARKAIKLWAMMWGDQSRPVFELEIWMRMSPKKN